MKNDQTISVTFFLFSIILALLSVTLLPFFGIRANRTSSGAGVSLWSTSPRTVIAITTCLATGFAGFFLRPLKVPRFVGFVCLSLVLPFSLMALAFGSGFILESQLPQARVSFGSGFLLLLIAVYGAISSYAPIFGTISNRAKKIALYVIVVSFFVLVASGRFKDLSIVREFTNRRTIFFTETIRHAFYAFGATGAALFFAMPLGYAASKSRLWEQPVFVLANTVQAIPTLSLLGLLIVPLSILGSSFPALSAIGVRGVGWAPAFIVLFLYAFLPIVANTQAGFRTIDPTVLDTALVMGMTKKECFQLVEFPIALPAIIAGFRTALIQNLGNAVLAGLIGGGGLGSLIFLGLAQASPDLVLLGSLPVIAAVFAADHLIVAIERVLK